MKKTIFVLSAVLGLAAIGCVRTVSDTHSFATTWNRDTVAGRYARPMDQVYAASTAVVSDMGGVMVAEYIPHDNTNNVRSLQGRVSDRKVWIRVQAIDQKTSQVDVQARTKWGMSDLDLVHEIEKEIALKLVH